MISVVEVLALHDRVVEKTGGSQGIGDEGGLLSAIGRPFQTFDGEDLYPTPFEKAVALLESVCNDHPFVDGNKRTALIAAAYLLHEYDINIVVPTVEGEQFMLLVAQHSPGVPAIAQQLERWVDQTA